MELEFEISNQSLVRTDSVGVVNQSVNYLSCVFTFKTTDWSNANKYALFKSESGENYCYSLGSECEVECTVPAKVLEHDLFRLTLFGLKDEERITTNLVTVKLVRSGFSTSIQSYEGDGTGDIFSDWVELLTDYILKSDTPGFVLNDGSIDTNVYLTEHQSLEDYVAKEQGKGLFSGSYTDLTDKPSIPTKTSDLSNDSGFLTSHQSLENYVTKENGKGLFTGSYNDLTNKPSLFSGNYNDLSNKPSIPTDVADLTDNSNTAFTPKSHTHGNITNDGKVGSDPNYFVYTTAKGAITSKQKIGNISINGTIGTHSGLSIITGAYGVLTTGSFGTTSGTFAEGNHTHSDYVNPTIADNLTTNDSTQVLSAKQGKALADLIGSAITYINQ